MKTLNMRNHVLGLTALTLLLAGATAGCGTEADDDVSSEPSALISSSGASVVSSYQRYKITDTNGVESPDLMWMQCGANQVVVGLHKEQQRVFCLPLPGENTPQETSLQLPYKSRTVLGMQGCPDGQYIQAIANSGTTGYLLCRKFAGLGWTTAFKDYGTDANTSWSSKVYNLSPTAHVCPATKVGTMGKFDANAMVGLHLGGNIFACAK